MLQPFLVVSAITAVGEYRPLSFEEAPLVDPLACCINGQELSGVGLENTVVVRGGGPLGCLHLQLAEVKGVGRTILIEVVAKRREFAQKVASPDLIINPREEDPSKKVKEVTEGKGADRVLALNLIAQKKVKVDKLVTHCFPLEKIAEERRGMKIAILS